MKQYCVINKMTYSEEEIKKYLNILRNFNDELDVDTPVLDKHIGSLSAAGQSSFSNFQLYFY